MIRKSMNVSTSENKYCSYNHSKPYNKKRSEKKKRIHRKLAAPLVQILYETCKQVFAKGKAGFVPSASDIKRIQLILDSMKPADVGLSPKMPWFKEIENQESAPVTYIHIYACEKFSIGIFCLPPDGVIPLHNHPGMTVFSKLLFGSMHVKSYDWANMTDQKNLEQITYKKGPSPGVKLAKVHKDIDTRAPCKSSILYPEAGGNMHYFKAITPCAILDVQGPPYSDDEGRHCTYYRDYPAYTEFSDLKLLEGEEKEEYAWLEERENPEEFIVVGGSYEGPEIVESY